MSSKKRIVSLAFLCGAIVLATLPVLAALPSTRTEDARPAAPSTGPVGPTKPVVVVNSPDHPVPVTGTITGDVTVANTPDVHVANAVMVIEAPRDLSTTSRVSASRMESS